MFRDGEYNESPDVIGFCAVPVFRDGECIENPDVIGLRTMSPQRGFFFFWSVARSEEKTFASHSRSLCNILL